MPSMRPRSRGNGRHRSIRTIVYANGLGSYAGYQAAMLGDDRDFRCWRTAKSNGRISEGVIRCYNHHIGGLRLGVIPARR